MAEAIAKTNKEKKDILRKHHQVLLDALDAQPNQYCPHMAFHEEGKIYMKFFPGELNMKKDVYTESITRDFLPEDKNRQLLVLKYDPDRWENYEQLNDKYKMVLVPVDDMIPVTMPGKSTGDEIMFDEEEDAPMNECSVRDLCAILWSKPVSGRPWLNKLIREQFKTR